MPSLNTSLFIYISLLVIIFVIVIGIIAFGMSRAGKRRREGTEQTVMPPIPEERQNTQTRRDASTR